jgi:tetratricopeptide (TPR) repeat protein
MTNLGLDLFGGIQDPSGRTLIRRNSKAAVAWFLKAANRGDPTAAGSLGYAYDMGIGTRRNAAQAIQWYGRAVRRGNSSAASNLATVYRDLGRLRSAFQWWKRAADMGDGDAAVDVGYCYQYGIGTRKDAVNASRMYRVAIVSKEISRYAREEAMFHLALHLIDKGQKAQAVPLLERVSTDDDFPEATSVLQKIRARSAYAPCRCRRFTNKQIHGHAKCVLHPR